MSSQLVEHLWDLLRVPVQGVAEIPDEVWEMELPDIAAYLGVIAVNPGKRYLATPPEAVWKHLTHYLTVAGADYKFYGHTEECLRLARLAIAESEELTYALWGTEIGDALHEQACVSWPFENLTILEGSYAEATAGPSDSEYELAAPGLELAH